MRKILISFALMLGVGTQTANAEVFLNSKVSSREKTVHSIVLLPPTAYKSRNFDLTDLRRLLNPLSGKRPIEEERVEALEPEISGSVSNALRKSGYLVNDSDFSIQALQSNPKMSNLVDSLRASHDILVQQMSLRPKDTKKGRYSLGKSVADLNLPSSVDVVAMVYASHRYGKGRNQWFALEMSFADAHTGEILCYFWTPRFWTGDIQGKYILKDLKRVPH